MKSLLFSLFSWSLRRRLFLGQNWAPKRTSPLSERSLLYRRGGDILKQKEMVLPKRTYELRPSLVSAKRPSSDDSLETEKGCSKRHRKNKEKNCFGSGPVELKKYHTRVGTSEKKKKERSITHVSRELRKQYHLTIGDGELFDVPPLVETSYGSLQAFDFTEDPKEEMQIFSGVKDLLVKYNVSKATDYELADILMTNSAVVRGMIYYVTFTGISVTTRHLKTFQAKLWVDFTDKMHLVYCREKP